MDLETARPQRADAAEEKPSGFVKTERVHDHPRVPAALAARQNRGLEIGRERPGREIEIGHADLLPLALRPWAPLGIGVGGDHDPVRGYASTVGLETPARARSLRQTHRASGVDHGAAGDRDAGESARVGERLDGAGAQIEERACIDVDADAPRRFLAAEHLHRRPARAPLRATLLDLGEARRSSRAMQRAIAHEFAVEPMLIDERLDLGGPVAQQLQEPLAIIRTEPRSRSRRARATCRR